MAARRYTPEDFVRDMENASSDYDSLAPAILTLAPYVSSVTNNTWLPSPVPRPRVVVEKARLENRYNVCVVYS